MKTKKTKKDARPHKELWGDAEMEDVLFEDDESEAIYHAEKVLMSPWMRYSDDPKGLYQAFKANKDAGAMGKLFAPFLQYCLGIFSLKEARERFIPIFEKECVVMAFHWHKSQSEGIFKIWNGRELAEAMKDLNGADRQKAKQAAIEIVRVFFKDQDEASPIIDKLRTEAQAYGDDDFLRKLEDAKREIWIDADGNPTFPAKEHFKKRPERYLLFKLLGENFIREHTDGEIADILNKNVDPDSEKFVDDDTVKEYRHQLGIRKKEGPGAPRKKQNEHPPIDPGDDRKIQEILESHKEDFKWYLFGDPGIEGFKKHLRKLKYGP